MNKCLKNGKPVVHQDIVLDGNVSLKPLAYRIENEKDTTLNTLYSHLDLEQETKEKGLDAELPRICNFLLKM